MFILILYALLLANKKKICFNFHLLQCKYSEYRLKLFTTNVFCLYLIFTFKYLSVIVRRTTLVFLLLFALLLLLQIRLQLSMSSIHEPYPNKNHRKHYIMTLRMTKARKNVLPYTQTTERGEKKTLLTMKNYLSNRNQIIVIFFLLCLLFVIYSHCRIRCDK